MYKKEELIIKALDILNGNPALSFFDICKWMKISRVTAYKYFKDKDDLMKQMCIYALDVKDEFLAQLDEKNISSSEKLKEIVLFFTEKLESFFFLYSSIGILSDNELEKRYYDQYEKIGHYLLDMQKKGEISKDESVTWMLYTLDGTIYSAYYALRDGVYSVAELKEKVYRSFVKSIS